jgi:hypothetical protein
LNQHGRAPIHAVCQLSIEILKSAARNGLSNACSQVNEIATNKSHCLHAEIDPGGAIQ